MKKVKLIAIVVTILLILVITTYIYKPERYKEKSAFVIGKISEETQYSPNHLSYVAKTAITESTKKAPLITRAIISNALNRWVDIEVWLHGENIWASSFVNREISYEYYTKLEYDSSVAQEPYHERVAVLLTQTVKGAFSENNKYVIFDRQVDEWESPNFYFYTQRERDTLKECIDILEEQGYSTKLGEGIISFDEAEQPDFGALSDEKREMVVDTAIQFLKNIGKPEDITEMYIMDFHISSGFTKVLYVIDNEYWETQIQIRGIYNKPFLVDEFDSDGYYRSQFKRIAYGIDISDNEKPQIISFPE
ncbi:MAG: hypothetical protein LBV33_08495 [Lachnospiraceae bacterium]|nr:hypothetical protein [Lachnospiraceae bacterium]